MFASLFFDHISRELNFFPLLNIWGKKGTGKSSYAMSLLAPFATDPETTSLQNASPVGFIRKLAQTANVPQWFDEYNNRLKDYKIEALKNIYDLVGKTIGAKTQDSKTRQSKILSPAILTGQEAPTINEAFLSRLIIVSLSKTKHSDHQKRQFNELQLEQKKRFGQCTH